MPVILSSKVTLRPRLIGKVHVLAACVSASRKEAFGKQRCSGSSLSVPYTPKWQWAVRKRYTNSDFLAALGVPCGREADGEKGNGKDWKGARGIVTGKFIQTHHCQRFHFRLKMHQKESAAGLCPDTLGKLKRSRSPEPLAAAGGYGRNRS